MSVWELLASLDTRNARVRDLEETTHRLRVSAETSDDRLQNLDERLRQVSLLAAALWELLKKASTLSDEDLLRALGEVRDLHQSLAGMPPPEFHCPACRHKIPPASTRCLYCGAAVTPTGTP